MPELPTKLPLEGLKVLDFCWVAMGPMTTKYLAEYGATVVRVESSKRPETLRLLRSRRCIGRLQCDWFVEARVGDDAARIKHGDACQVAG